MNARNRQALRSTCFLAGSLCILWLALSVPNSSAADAVGTAGAAVIVPISMVQDSGLNFGAFAKVNSSSIGTVTIGVTGLRTIVGPIDSVTTGDEAAGQFTVSGEANAAYGIILPVSVVIARNGDTNPTTVDNFLDSKGGASTLDGTGADSFTVGATFNVVLGLAPFSYTGDYQLSVAYD